MAMSIRPDPQPLRQRLETELHGIENKRMGDERWYEVEGDRLVLHERPRDWWALFCKFLRRLFTSELSTIERKFESITQLVEDYLDAENNPNDLSQFLLRYTLAINELYRCAARMQQARRISENALTHMRAHPKTERLIITEQDSTQTIRVGGRAYHPYRFMCGVTLRTDLPGQQKVRFKLANEAGPERQICAKVYPHKHNGQIAFESHGEPQEIWAEITQEIALKAIHHNCAEVTFRDYGDRLDAGRFRRSSQEERGLLRFTSHSSQSMQIVISTEEREVHRLTVGPSESQDFSVPEELRSSALKVQTIFSTARQAFKPCKLAHYSFEVIPYTGTDSLLMQTVRPYWVSRRGEARAQMIVAGQQERFGGEKHGELKLYVMEVPGIFTQHHLLDSSYKFNLPSHDSLIRHLAHYLADQPGRLESLRQQAISMTLREDEVTGLGAYHNL